MNAFPSDDILVARGKYSTLAGERRDALKAMRHDLELLVSAAGAVLRSPDDIEFMRGKIVSAGAIVDRLEDAFSRIEALQLHIDSLKPLAWGAKEKDERDLPF